MTVYAYPVKDKKKSEMLCAAFVEGCGGVLVTDGVPRVGDSFFYGVDDSNVVPWKAALRDYTNNFYYCDNSYFDPTRQTSFRVTKNLLQHTGLGVSDCKRFSLLNIPIEPWRNRGKHIVLCEQSLSFMRMPIGYTGVWLQDVISLLKHISSRPLRIRSWARDKKTSSSTLRDDLNGAHALVTWSSAAAVTSALAGVPVVCMGQCAAAPMSGAIHQIESLPTPDDRLQWAGVLADNQFTFEELRNGHAWRVVNG